MDTDTVVFLGQKLTFVVAQPEILVDTPTATDVSEASTQAPVEREVADVYREEANTTG